MTKIKIKYGQDLKEVDATILKYLCVHSNLDDPLYFSITHIKSGLSLIPKVHSLKSTAITIAKILDDISAFEDDVSEIVKNKKLLSFMSKIKSLNIYDEKTVQDIVNNSGLLISQEKDKKCICDIMILMRIGCQCGGK